MNYSGKFDGGISLDSQGSNPIAYVHVDSFTAKAHGHVPQGAFVVPDPNLIFNGEFKRAGLDLVLSHEGHDFVVHDYFRGDKRAAIASPDGAYLTGDVVNALTGHVQYAQAAPGAAAAQVIGHVTKLSGSATAVRNGVSVILNNGDNVEKGDVVSTGADSTLGITFIDGTVFGLSSNARMVLNEMVYDPNGSNNSSLLSLVAGTITFVAGETAKHGDMKVDTPVATMGIRGTAVLTQINFVVPAGGGDPQPQASFQVLVEPNGTTGSYILFDRVTLLPIATVNQAGQMIQISGGNVSVSSALLSPDVQKLITDVFTLKFTDNNSNTKLTTNFTDTITQTSAGIVIKTPAGFTATAVFTNLNPQDSLAAAVAPPTSNRIPGPPQAQSLDLSGNVTTAFSLTERAAVTGDTKDSDTVSGQVTFVDQNLSDRPTVSVNLTAAPNYVYKNASQQDVTASLTALQKQDIAATQININVVAAGGNTNNGSAVWTYTIPDHVFDFLAAGETLTLTYMISVDDNFSLSPNITYIPITITITGTNDKPVITTSVPTITFEGGTSVPGGPLISDDPTSGTLTFDDVDLTDTHEVGVSHFSAVLPGGTVPKKIYDLLSQALKVSIEAGDDSTGSGTGTITWSLQPIKAYLADFIPEGKVLTLTYTVTVSDSQGATSDQTITVTITGTDAAAVVWIATGEDGLPSGGFWKDGDNWETGTVPTIDDDVIVITDQLHGLTPAYPVTIDAAAYAKSLTMNDFGGPQPELINQSSLTIAGALNMNAASILINAGTMSVGGEAEILDTSVLTNEGDLTLAGGGDFAVGTKITNSGTIELSGGTLKTLAEIHNTDGTLKADAGTTLIVDSATVDGGTVTILGTLQLDGASVIENGTLNNSSAVNVNGTVEFAHEAVSNTSSGTIKVLANGWLTVDQGSSVTNDGTVTVDASGKLTVNGATIKGGAGIGAVTNNGELELTGDAVLSNGILKNNGVLNVSGAGNALHDETVTNAGTIEVLANGVLAIDHGTISGGAIKGSGTIDVTGASKIDGGASLSIGTVTADAELTLDGVTVSGTVITDNSSIALDNTVKLKEGARIQGASAASKGVIANNGTLEIAGAAALLNAVLTNTGHVIQIDGGQTLTLSGAEIIGGSIDNYSGVLGGTIDVTDNSKLVGNVTLNKGTLTVGSGVTLRLDDATIAEAAIINDGIVNVGASKKATLNGATLTGGTLTVSGTLESTGATTITGTNISNTYLIEAIGGVLALVATTSATAINDGGIIRANGGELDINGEAVTNTGTLAAINHGTLKLTAMTVANTGGTIMVDGASKFYLTDVSINGGSLSNAGNLYSVSGLNTITGGVTNTGIIEVESGTLNLSGGLTGAGTLIIDDKATLELGGDVSGAVGLNVVARGDVTITNNGHITGTTYAIFETGGAVTINNSGDINGNISVATATFNNDAGGTWTVSGTSVFGTLSTIDNAGTIDLRDGASISSADGKTFGITNSGGIESWGTATITGTITNTGTIEVSDGALTLFGSLSGSGSVTIDAGATLKLEGTVSQTITFSGGAELQIETSSFGGSIKGFAATDKIDLSTIKFDGGTSATYDPVTGDLVVSDAYGHSITLKLLGADYSSAHFAGSSDGHGGTLITLNADDDAPSFAAAEASPHVSFTERANTTGSGASDPAPAATGTIHFTDIDLTDRPTATITSQSVTWLDANHTTHLTLTPDETAALEHALTLEQAGKNNGTVTWSYSIADGALDFLGVGQTATVVSTIKLDDHHGGTDTAQVTVTITGANDAPTLASVTIGPLVDTAVTDSFSNLTGKLIGTDADRGDTATLTYAVLDSTNHAAATVAGHYGSLTVNSDGTYSYVPDAAAINALPAGSYSDTFKVQTTDVHGASGTATLTVDVTGANDAPVFNVDQISVTQYSDERVIVHGLSVTDADAAANERFTIAATTHDSGSNVSPSSGAGSLAYINSKLQTVTYREGSGEPSTDKVTLTVTDGHGATDTINLIFNLAENANDHVSLVGTTGKDVFFGTSYQDQFVFAANSNHDTIVNFTPHQDHIDLSAVVTTSSVSDWMSQHVAASPTNSADTLITIDPADTILLKGVSVSALHASDFIVHS